MFSFHDMALIVLFGVGFSLGCWSMWASVQTFFSWLRSRRKNP